MFEHIKVRLGLTILTKENAIQYVRAMLDYYPNLVIVSAKHTTELGVPAINVTFKCESSEPDNPPYVYTVWIENERLYGEW